MDEKVEAPIRDHSAFLNSYVPDDDGLYDDFPSQRDLSRDSTSLEGLKMAARLEHANINVRSIDETIRFVTTAMPEFQVRGRGEVEGRPWVHVGTEASYLAINEFESGTEKNTGGASGTHAFGLEPLNHLGFVVDDAEALAARLIAAGYREGFVVPPHPYRIRKYFFDRDGNEWEFVEYLTDDPAMQNEYLL